MWQILLFVVGLALLIIGAVWLVGGASSLARRLGISDLAIGLTVVAFGTSSPELLVSVQAAIQGNSDIAIGNVLGSNIFNIMVILGLSSLIYPLSIKRGTVWKEIPFSLLAAMLLGIQASDALFDASRVNLLDRIDGLVFLSFFVIFLFYIASIMKAAPLEIPSSPKKDRSISATLFFIAVGMAGLALGAQWVIQGATFMATRMGVSQRVIALTVVAAGTSLPELATSVAAVFKKNHGIAVGNIVGSNIFNIFLILGITSLVRPLPFQPSNRYDIMMVIIASVLLFVFMFTGKNKKLDRWEGGLFVVMYSIYLIFIIWQN